MSLGTAYGLAVGLLALLNIGLVARLAAFRRDFPTLREWDGPGPASWPKLSVIVPCRNEAAGVEKAMSSQPGNFLDRILTSAVCSSSRMMMTGRS